MTGPAGRERTETTETRRGRLENKRSRQPPVALLFPPPSTSTEGVRDPWEVELVHGKSPCSVDNHRH